MAMGMTAPVVTGTAAGAVGATGQVEGLDGLFAALMGSGFVQGDVPQEMTEMLTQMGVGTTAAGMPVENVLQLGNAPAVKVQGEQDVVNAFVVKVQELFDKFAKEGVMPKGTELAAALEKLGMPADQAAEMATRIDTVMAMVAQQQDLDKDTENSIEAMVLAAMMGGLQNGFQIEIVREVTASVQAEVHVNVGVMRLAQAGVSSGDLARQMSDIQLGNQQVVQNTRDGQRSEGFERQKAAPEADLERAGAGKTPRMMVAVTSSNGGEVMKVRLLQEVDENVVRSSFHPVEQVQDVAAVVQKDADAVVDDGALPVPQQVKVDVPRPDAVRANADAFTRPEQDKDVPAAALRGNRAERVLERPEGKEMYRWQVDAKGHESVQVVTPADESSSVNVLAQQAAAAAAQGGSSARDGQQQGMAFGDRLQMAAQARVVEQVTVQIKPLADMGGGTVRMTLNPPELGQVHVNLTMKDGQVSGAISASDPVVVEQLARELHNLRHGLADAGLKLGEQGISLMLSSNGQQQNPQGQPGQHAFGFGGAGGSGRGGAGGVAQDGTEIASVESAAHWVAPDRIVDVRI